jgi:hypothetical protein
MSRGPSEPGGPHTAAESSAPGGRRMDAALRLLDHQLVDRDGRLCGKVDDLELERLDDGSLAVTAVLTGPGALGPRLPGVLGRATVAVWRRLHGDAEPGASRIPFERVTEIDSAVRLAMSRVELPTYGLERWARENVVEKLPGAGRASE